MTRKGLILSLFNVMRLVCLMAPLTACMGIDDYKEVDEDPVYDWIEDRS